MKLFMLRLSPWLTVVICVCVLESWGHAQNHDVQPASPWVPREILERPEPIRAGIGKVHEKVTTASPQAQAFYDQGLAYLHSYVWIEAARSFNQAIRMDRNLAMAYLGLSDVFIGLDNIQAARHVLEEAESLKDKVTEAEQRRIEIRRRQMEFIEDSHNLQKYFAFRQAISDALKKNSEDPWLWILRGFADEGTPFAHGQNGGVDTLAFYKIALSLSPHNFVAHHYLAHTFEQLGQTEQALANAQAYVRLAPLIPHAHHMVGHELMRLGRTADAIAQFRRANELETDYYLAEHIAPGEDWHHAHNLNLLAMCYEALGQMKSAEQRLRESFDLPANTDLAELNRSAWPEFLLHEDRNQEALEAARKMLNSNFPMLLLTGHSLAGRAFLAMHRTDDARTELTLAEQAEKMLPPSLQLLPYAHILQAELLLSEGNRETGASLMKKVEQKIRAIPGPDAWRESVFQLESIGRVARETGVWDLAQFTAEQMIEQDPNYAGGYYELGLCAEHRGDAAGTRLQFAHAQTLWSEADAQLPEMANITRQLAKSP